MQPVSLAIILYDPEAVEFSYPVWTSRIERRALALGHFLRLAKEFARRRLIESSLELFLPNGFEKVQGTNTVNRRRVLRHLERNFDVALGREIVNLIRHHRFDQV